MAITTITFAAASCSWIDPATGLPEVDVNRVTWDSAERSFFVGNNGYRFCNFMEVSAQADFGARLIATPLFTADSKMYRGPSFARIPSHAFSIQQEVFTESDAVRFTQVVGARTVSPEVIGGLVGGVAGAIGGIFGGIVGDRVGREVAHRAKGFPPIWSKIQIRIYYDGRMEAQLLQHSLFPSLTYYIQAGGKFQRSNHPNGSPFYDATKTVQLPDWQANGWGPLKATSVPGPTAGNPWGIVKETMGSENEPTPV
jgi:hypothetical protein